MSTTAHGPAFMMPLRGSEMNVEMMVMRSVENAAASTADTMPKIERVRSIGIMTLNESETACGTSSPRLILSFSTPRS